MSLPAPPERSDRRFGEALARHGLVAILRSTRGTRLPEVISVLAGAGVRLIEVTVRTPGCLAALRETGDRLPAGVYLGAGTVTTLEEVEAVRAAGGTFTVSPHCDPEQVRAARDARLAALPGAMTPTEILTAWRAGATAVKVFPAARAGGPSYTADVHATLPEIPLVPTGGIGAGQIAAYRAAGAVAVGVGSPLLGDALDGGSLTELASRARDFVAAAAAR
ncbi:MULTISPECIES: bifunctional 4-hydroxy-2-oxoglutarate aldolase/2-dehydro-3-deoxy-phosphogluconate aldolase [Streptomycetaceae]|jgi:2-dehydro-3-deoxyphosphogluconate aldolase/(4S)-4-hydroxy-2-oxoglutarate aldolase|uniref:bifunctional 4-hydroxy-2-oxoglutarate aldolase/2-dehydro-3-deoxy-phosphogluconate aldolase n=1 Tax=Streptomycetaceae TaxID=2062 RepID=UPI00300BD2D7